MAMAMELDSISELELDNISGYSTTTTTTTTEEDDINTTNWNNWSPVVDWEAFSCDNDHGFQGLIASMMDEDDQDDLEHILRSAQDGYNSIVLSDPSPPPPPPPPTTTTTVLKETPTVLKETTTVLMCEDTNNNDLKGLRLVHLLMAAAEALTGANKSRDLVKVILVRLKELVSPSTGTNMERLAAYFTEALQGLLEGAGGVHNKTFISNGSHSHTHRYDQHHPTDVLSAFQLLQDMSPYVKFGHFTANQAILEATVHDRRVHIVDYDIMEGIQWASLMQALVSRKDGPPTPHLRITALTRGNNSRKSIGTVQDTGRRLIAFAASIGQPFSFHQCRLDPDETFRPSNLKLVKGEALIINCMLHFPHFSYRAPDSVASFLSGAKALNPRLVTLVEEEVGPTRDGGFVGRFIDSLHHYSAVFDSLEAGFPMQSRARALVERVFLGPRIAGTLARIYRARGNHNDDVDNNDDDDDNVDNDNTLSLGEWMGCGGGYKGVEISFFNHCQAKLLLGLFNDGYRVEEFNSNRLVLGWKNRRLLSASLWTHTASSPSISTSSTSSTSTSSSFSS